MAKLFLFLFSVCLSFGAQADEEAVASIIMKGFQAYQAGDANQAITSLEQAIELISLSQSKGLDAFLPAAPAGWQIVPDSKMTESNTTIFKTMSASQSYVKNGQTVKVTMYANSEMVDLLTMPINLYQGVEELQQSLRARAQSEGRTLPDQELTPDQQQLVDNMVKMDGATGLFSAEDSSFIVSLYTQGAAIQLEGDGVADKSVGEAFMNQINLAGFKAFAEQFATEEQ